MCFVWRICSIKGKAAYFAVTFYAQSTYEIYRNNGMLPVSLLTFFLDPQMAMPLYFLCSNCEQNGWDISGHFKM